MMVVSKKNETAFDPTGIVMGGHAVEQNEELKLVGYIFDESLSWGPMIGALAKKARTRTDAIRRMSRSLDSENMLTMYSAFVRPILEYGSTLYMGAGPSHLGKLDRVQATMERIGGFKAEPLAARREAALIALSLKQLDGDCREGLRDFVPVLVTVKIPAAKVERSRRDGLLRPDYSEKSQSRRTSESTADDIVKIDVTIAPGLQVKDPSRRPKRCTTLDVFRDSAAGALPAIWAKLPQTLVLRGEDKGWRKIIKQCKDFLIGRKQKIRKNTQGKKQKMIVIEQLAVSNSTVLNQELNWGSTDWNKEAELIKSLLSQPIKCND